MILFTAVHIFQLAPLLLVLLTFLALKAQSRSYQVPMKDIIFNTARTGDLKKDKNVAKQSRAFWVWIGISMAMFVLIGYTL